jgi:hypothetical protein
MGGNITKGIAIPETVRRCVVVIKYFLKNDIKQKKL